MRHIGIILFLSMCSIAMMAQSAHKLLIEGDQSYLNEEYLTAEESYRKAQQKNSTTKSNFNLGNAVYQQERYEEAVQHYESTFNVAEDDLERANALYNLGNAQLKTGQIEAAIDTYKKANQQQQQQEQQQQDEQNNEQNEEQQSNDQQQDQQQQGDDQQQQDQQPQDSDIENPSEEQQQAAQGQELSKEDALKLLEVIENEEKNVQEKLRKVSGNKTKPKKDW